MTDKNVESLDKVIARRLQISGVVEVYEADKKKAVSYAMRACELLKYKSKVESLWDGDAPFLKRVMKHIKDGDGVLIAVDAVASFGKDPIFQACIKDLAIPLAPFDKGRRPRLILIETSNPSKMDIVCRDIEHLRVPLPSREELEVELDGFIKAWDKLVEDTEAANPAPARSKTK